MLLIFALLVVHLISVHEPNPNNRNNPQPLNGPPVFNWLFSIPELVPNIIIECLVVLDLTFDALNRFIEMHYFCLCKMFQLRINRAANVSGQGKLQENMFWNPHKYFLFSWSSFSYHIVILFENYSKCRKLLGQFPPPEAIYYYSILLLCTTRMPDPPQLISSIDFVAWL